MEKCEIGKKLQEEYDRILFDDKHYKAFCDEFVEAYRALRDHEKTCAQCQLIVPINEKGFTRARIVALESEIREMREKLGKDLDGNYGSGDLIGQGDIYKQEVENGNEID